MSDPAGRPLADVCADLENASDAPYLLWERHGDWTLARGAEADLTLTAAQVVVSAAGRSHTRPVGADPMHTLAEAVASVPATGTRVRGWLSSDLARVRAGIAVPPDTVLARLFVPRHEETGHGVAVDPGAPSPTPPDLMTGAADYRDRVADAVARIRAGELAKVVVSRRVPVGFRVDLQASYLRGRAANTPARSFLLDLGGWRAFGFSPETVLEVADGVARTQPLAGTRAADVEDEAARREELLRDPKEVFEHAISVSEAVTEMQDCCARASVVVEEFMTIARRRSVQHLGSRVRGTLAPGRTAWDALGAVFPAVTATGLPKDDAVRCLDALEPSPRGLYGGAVVVAERDGSALDACLVLRSVFEHDDRTWLQAGAGVVAASDPARELEETCEKLRSVAPYLVAAA